MKWNPIIDGDLNGIPRDEELLFTVFDEGYCREKAERQGRAIKASQNRRKK